MDILDCHPVVDDMQAEILLHLEQKPRHLPSKYFYDSQGAELFEAICELPEYYPTRTEIGILDKALTQIVKDLGPERWVVEPGSGSGIKTRMLLQALQRPSGYVPIDISKNQLRRYGAELKEDFPQLAIRPVCADFTNGLTMPVELHSPLIWFPGSTIGNFSPTQAQALLKHMRSWGTGRPELLIGVDLRKDRDTLEAAYNDSQGVTAAFNRNLLSHINRALGAGIDERGFVHEARWNEDIGAIQMFLVSQRDQDLHINGKPLRINAQEAICTEYSYKYEVEQFQKLALDAGWSPYRVHTDPRQWFGIFHLR